MKINKTHWDELVLSSAVHPEIVQLNVQSINKVEGYSPSSLLFDLLHPNPKRNNSGRLEAAALRQFDNCLETSGWWVSGIDPQTWDDMEWGRFKPDPDTLLAQPHFNKKTGQWDKAAKYRSPAGVPSRLVFLKVPDSIWYRVSDRYNVPITEEEREHPGGFWHWVHSHVELPIIYVEGEKKAGCLLSLEYIAIPLPGIWMGRRYADPVLKLGENLIPEVQLLAQPGRQITILFDNDPKLKTKKQVFKATVNLAKLLDKEGCTVNVATLPSIEGEKNAVDDFIVSGGDIAPILSSAVDWKFYKNNSHPSNWKQPSTEEREKAKQHNWFSQFRAGLKTWQKQLNIVAPTEAQTISFYSTPTQRLANKLGETLLAPDSQGDFLYNKKALLKLLADHDKSISLRLYPSVGYQSDKALHHYKKLGEWLTKKGYQLEVGWYEQWYKKSATLYDFLESGDEIKYISWEEFLDKNRYAKLCYKRNKEFTPNIELNQKYLDGEAIAKQIIRHRSLTPIKSHMGTGKTVSIGEILKYHCAEKSQLPELNQKLDRLTSAYKEIEGKLNTPNQLSLLSESSDLTALKNEKQELKEQIDDLNQQIETETIRVEQTIANKGAFLLAHRNSLLQQTCKEQGFTHLRFEEAYNLTSRPNSRLAFCPDSIVKFEYQQLEDKVVFLDEISSILPHILVGATCKRYRRQIIDKFTYMLRHAYAVISLDANQKNWEVDHLQKLGQFDLVTKIQNIYEKKPLYITFFEGSEDRIADDIIRNSNDYLPLIADIKRNYINGKNQVICSDSQNFTEFLHQYLGGEENKEVIRVDGQTISEDFIRELSKDPNRVKELGCKVLIYSPTWDSGISCTLVDYFHQAYSLNFHLGAENFSQLPGRIRDTNIPWIHWSKEFLGAGDDGMRSSNPEKVVFQTLAASFADIKNSFSEEENEALRRAFELVNKSQGDENFLAACQIKAQENYEKQNLRETYYEKLVEDGHNVRRVWGDALLDDDWKAAKEEVKDRYSTLLYNAENISILEAEEIQQSLSATPEKQRAAAKAILTLVRLPGLLDTPLWQRQGQEFLKFLKYKDRKCISRLELRHILHNPELDICRKQAWLQYLNIGVESDTGAIDKIVLNDIYSPQHRAKILRDIGILDLIENTEAIYDNKSPELEAIAKRANHWTRQPYLGRRGGLDLIRYTNKILGQVGYKLATAKKGEDKRYYKLTDLYESEALPITSNLMPIITSKYESKFEAARTYTQKAIEVLADTSINDLNIGDVPAVQMQSDSKIDSFLVGSHVESLTLDKILPSQNLLQGKMKEFYGLTPSELTADMGTLIEDIGRAIQICDDSESPAVEFMQQIGWWGWSVWKEAARHSQLILEKVLHYSSQLIASGEWKAAPEPMPF